MDPCALSLDLLRSLKVSEASGKFLPPFDQERIKQVLAECEDIFLNIHKETRKSERRKEKREEEKREKERRKRRRLEGEADGTDLTGEGEGGESEGQGQGEGQEKDEERREKQLGMSSLAAPEGEGDEEEQEEEASSTCSIFLHYACLLRHKRTVLSYLSYRLSALRELYWQQGGAVLPSSLASSLSEEEKNYFQSYSSLLSSYFMENDGFPFSSDLSPPKSLSLTIRVLKNDLGVIETEAGPVSLSPFSIHLMKRAQAEKLIRQGKIVHINDV